MKSGYAYIRVSTVKQGFFGTQRYICNGGVQVFQNMRDYFTSSYVRLLEEAYRKAGSFYSAAFDETELDWIFAANDPDLSRVIEWALYRLSRYDFRTAKVDLLSGL